MAAKTPIVRMDVVKKASRYAADLTRVPAATAGSTPSTPPGPATPCTTPTPNASSFCSAGLSFNVLLLGVLSVDRSATHIPARVLSALAQSVHSLSCTMSRGASTDNSTQVPTR